MRRLRQIRALDPREKAFSLWDEFKAFAFKGSVIDLAVGVIIGAAFGKLVDSLVKNLVMPLVNLLVPGPQSYAGWKWVIHGKEIPYGLFLADVVNFLIIAATLFLFIVKFLGWAVRSRQNEAAAPRPPSRQEELLAEIRDLLKSAAARPGTQPSQT